METGALGGTQQLAAYLKQLGIAYEGVYGSIKNINEVSKTMIFLRVATLKSNYGGLASDF
jgi:hypothetical protein